MNPRIPNCCASIALGLLWAGPLLAAPACGGSPASSVAEREHAIEGGEEGHGKEGVHGARVVRLDAATLEEFGVELAIAGPGWIEKTVSLPAEVRPNQDRLAHIAPRFPGIAREVRAAGALLARTQELTRTRQAIRLKFTLTELLRGVREMASLATGLMIFLVGILVCA